MKIDHPARAALAALACATAAALGAPSASFAAVDCEYVDVQPKRAEVTLTAAGDETVLDIDDFGILRVDGKPCPGVGAVPANRDNLDEIRITDTSGGSTSVELRDPASFAPGLTPESGPDEIELTTAQGVGTGDRLILEGRNDQDDRFVAGYGGIDVTTGDDPSPDVDVRAFGYEELVLVGLGGSDRLDASGGGVSGEPVIVSTVADGGAGDDSVGGGAGEDVLRGGSGTDAVTYERAGAGVSVDLGLEAPQDTGGAGTDSVLEVERAAGSPYDDHLVGQPNVGGLLDGGDGDDVLVGAGWSDELLGDLGDDTLEGGDGSDYLEGGPGRDRARYTSALGRVFVDLSKAYPQQTGSAGHDWLLFIEDVVGGPFADVLRGTVDDNVLVGGAGADDLDGYGGPDILRIRDGEGDVAHCGEGADRVVADSGLDTLDGCETVDFPAVDKPPTAPPPGDPAPPPGDPAPPPGDPAQPYDDPAPPAGDPAPPVPPVTGPESSRPAPDGPAEQAPPVVPSPATHDTALLLRLGGRRAQRAGRRLSLTALCPLEQCRIEVRPVLRAQKRHGRPGRRIALPVRRHVLVPGHRRTISVRLSRRVLRVSRRARARRVVIRVVATDEAGNTVTRRRSIRVR